MYLKRLDLHGFKSFAARTAFEFGHGITAIVGPNGSGKSNIADALRWVLGEQSSRLLRARKLEDIIYAGSGKRAKSDRVEVAITLDNEKGWLPLDVSEVNISRKGSRSGDSDYFINGKKTRLRELQALLLKATVSQSSYAIIGQGLVETVLNLRAEERRELIEEAADIARYRFRIEEAEERLKSTHDNVERVKLLMKEIAPRLGRLERQAKVAGEHARLSRDLTRALQVYYEAQWHKAQESLTVARASQDQAQAELMQCKVAMETCQRELGDITTGLDEQRRAAAAASAQRDRLDSRIRVLERELLVGAERHSILGARGKELAEELVSLRSESERLSALLGGEDDERDRLKEAVSAARSEFEARQAALVDLEREHREALGRVTDAEAKGKRLEAAAEELKTRARRLLEGQREAEKDSSRLETRRRSLINQMAEQLRLLRGHRAQESQLVSGISETGERRRSLARDVQLLREQLTAVETTQSERRAKLEGLNGRLAVLLDAQKQAESGRTEGAISIEGALSTVFEVIRVPRGLEDAIAAALSDQLEAFVFERQSEAIAAIQTVVAQNGPRTVVIPLDTMKPLYPLSLMKEKGVVGVAARLVKYQQRFEKLVNALLGRTIVVQDAQTAARLVKRGIATVVTQDGVVFHPAGHISGGRAQAGREFAMAYERDLELIPKEVEKVQRSMAVTEREAESLREKLGEAEVALGAIAQEADDALGRRSEVQASLGQRQERLAQLRGEMKALVGAQQDARGQGRRVMAEAARLDEEREQVLADAKESFETGEYLAKANSVIDERRQEFQAVRDEAADLLARADAEHRTIAVQRESREAAHARVLALVSSKEQQAGEIGTELARLEETAGSEQEQIAQAQVELDTFVQEHVPSEGVNHLEARQRDLHSQVLSSQSRMFEAEKHVLEAETDVRRWQMEIENLVAHMAEDGMAVSAEGDVVAPEAVQTRIPFWLAAAEAGDDGPGGLRPIRGGAPIDPDTLGREIEQMRAELRNLGPVNIEALGDYESMRERHDFLAGQVEDLESAEVSLHRAIDQLTGLMEKRFTTTFDQVARSFEQNFHAFFGEGGHAVLRLSDPKDMNTTGVEIEARPPGKRTRSLSQLSGGEKALTSLSLLFALLQANPSPFCVLDEVDAMLDEVNVGRFAEALKDLAKRTQFIVITHNRRTIETADSIYGVSMAPDAASRVLSMRLADVAEVALN